MTRPTRLEVNCTTGEQSIIELTDEEIAQLEVDRQAWEAEQIKREAEAQIQAEIKASALVKLAELGLTLDEAKAVIG